MPRNFYENQKIIIDSLSELQNIDITNFSFLEKYTLCEDFEKKIHDRMKLIQDIEIKSILERITSIFPSFHGKIKEEYCICHNDFRADNILISPEKNHAWIIDVEGFIISDRYIDIAEFYIGGIFWNTFIDEDLFNYDTYVNLLDTYGYKDRVKQKYLYILEYCSYLSWIAMHISTTEKPLDIYIETLEINRKKYYRDVQPFILQI